MIVHQKRDYQDAQLTKLAEWFANKNNAGRWPLLVAPTGSGKSFTIANIAESFRSQYPGHDPKILVLVPSKELAEQDGEKLAHILPDDTSIGYYSASLGKKETGCDVTVATIGSIYKKAADFMDVNVILIDEAHVSNPDDEGRYREFINTLSLVGNFIVIGLTATPFRGNGVWLTEGKAPLFGGIAHEVKIKELIDKGYLAPLVLPEKKVSTTIDTSSVSVASTGDYVIGELDDALMPHLESIAEEVSMLTLSRKKIIAFTPSVKSAHALCAELRGQLFRCEVVCGETDKHLRAMFIQQFRDGELDCLVTVLALAVGFDVPDIDCVVWCRPTQSPVLYIQGAGRGLRAAPGKTDCLWLDFSDTTERLGPIDAVTGRKKIKRTDQGAPYAICPECKSMVTPASLMECPYCGATLREPKVKTFTGASDAPVMASQITSKRHRVTEVNYYPHEKPGSPPSIRVVYMSGYMKVATEWICPLHKGYAGSYAGSWIKKRATTEGWAQAIMDNATTELQVIQGIISYARTNFRKPTTILVSKSGKYPDITGYDFSEHKEEECA